jgi:hypothetical protein
MPAIIAYPIRAVFILGVVLYFGMLICCAPFVWFYEQVKG